jgi:hypothetical protein
MWEGEFYIEMKKIMEFIKKMTMTYLMHKIMDFIKAGYRDCDNSSPQACKNDVDKHFKLLFDGAKECLEKVIENFYDYIALKQKTNNKDRLGILIFGLGETLMAIIDRIMEDRKKFNKPKEEVIFYFYTSEYYTKDYYLSIIPDLFSKSDYNFIDKFTLIEALNQKKIDFCFIIFSPLFSSPTKCL